MDMLFSFVNTTPAYQEGGALAYGSGMFLFEENIVGHPGTVPGYFSIMARGLDDDLTVVLFGPQPDIDRQAP